MAVRRVAIARRVRDRALVPKGLAGPVPPEDDSGGLDAVRGEGLAETPAEEPRRCAVVARELDVRTHVSQHAR